VAWRIYKEGQGKWLRGSLAAIIALGGIFGVRSLHNQLGPLLFSIPGINWQFDGRLFIEAPILIGVLAWGVYLYNKPKVVDFLIDTENELKNRVTWPSKKEELNASIVVVVTVVITMFFIFTADQLLTVIKKWMYHG
jgi:preprotein translocase SecE subunit